MNPARIAELQKSHPELYERLTHAKLQETRRLLNVGDGDTPKAPTDNQDKRALLLEALEYIRNQLGELDELEADHG